VAKVAEDRDSLARMVEDLRQPTPAPADGGDAKAQQEKKKMSAMEEEMMRRIQAFTKEKETSYEQRVAEVKRLESQATAKEPADMDIDEVDRVFGQAQTAPSAQPAQQLAQQLAPQPAQQPPAQQQAQAAAAQQAQAAAVLQQAAAMQQAMMA
ncbi:unnamed protein product, partial [Prorocentrum cordatum]